MEWPADKIERKKVDDLIPYARNARTHSDEQVAQLAASIKEWGWTTPVLVDEDGEIIAGHGRVMAARKLNIDEIPTMTATGWSKAQKQAYILADNQLPQNAGWDMDLLSVEMKDLDSEGFDLSLIGFDDDMMANMLVEETKGLTDEDAVPDVPDDPVTVEGDVWLLGNHRLMCGDSTARDSVDTLLNGAKADLVFTDPPYNVDYKSRGKDALLAKGIKNDAMSVKKFKEFLGKVMTNYFEAMRPLACIYVCHPDSASAPKLAFEESFASNFHKSSTIIWVKQSAGMGWQDYRSQHEPILYGWKPGEGNHGFYAGRDRTTVWEFKRDAQATYVHPTQKPVALVEEGIKNSSKVDDIVLDLFGGSGSTLIAAEKNGRHSRLMELDPKYCDVIVQRWQDFTGKQAQLEGSGGFFPTKKGMKQDAA